MKLPRLDARECISVALLFLLVAAGLLIAWLISGGGQ
jgi:hypothetical protein